MRLSPPPPAASWVHRDVRTGFEVAFFRTHESGIRLTGHTTAREASALWSVSYDVELDETWRTRVVRASALTAAVSREQRYTLTTVTNEGSLFHYESSTFDFSCELRYDRAGLVVDYPGIAVIDS